MSVKSEAKILVRFALRSAFFKILHILYVPIDNFKKVKKNI